MSFMKSVLIDYIVKPTIAAVIVKVVMESPAGKSLQNKIYTLDTAKVRPLPKR